MSGWAGRSRALLAAPALLAAATVVAYAVNAQVLLRYPYDWAPDEGFYLDCARRLVQAPDTVYGRSLVPYPCFYTPLLFAALAPGTGSPAPLLWGRLLAVAWTAATVAAAYRLVRRRGPLPLAAAAAALVVAPLDLSFWHLLIRMDGLMIALWMAGAVAVLPEQVTRGADRLGGARLAAGVAALTGAFLAKQTALVHAAPLVACWLLVDRRSALRLGAALAAAVAASLAVLDLASGGGFSAMSRWWGAHPLQLAQFTRHTGIFLARAWPLLLLAAAGGVACWRRGERPWRDGAVWLWLGGLAILPAMAKYGALWTYLLPLLCATAVLAGRWWSPAAVAPAGRAVSWAALMMAVVGGALAATRTFPLPDSTGRATAEAFYSFVRLSSEQRPGPLLATRPEYAYFVSGQPVEVEGASFPLLVKWGAPGIERVLERVRGQAYRLVIRNPEWYPRQGPFHDALVGGYEPVGGCVMLFMDGPSVYTFFAPKGSGLAFQPPPGTLCWSGPGAP
jgi:hypothetical protein